MTMRATIRSLALAGSALAAAAATPAAAQLAPQQTPTDTVPAASDTSDSDSTPNRVDTTADATDAEGIVVTARRREENVLDVPIAVSVFSAEALARAGAIDITDVGQVVPNTTLEPSRGTNNTLTAFIRGVGQQDPVAGFEAGVGIYLDDVYLNRPQAAVLDIYDVERIEVLRGPQGTLYGRNTIGGAIKYVTRGLPDRPSIRGRATYGTYDQADGVLSASATIGDLVRIGGSVARLSRGGFGDNLNLPGVENYNKDITAGRGTFELGGHGQPVLIRISGDYARDKSDPRNGHRLIPGLQSGAPVLSDVYDTRAGLNRPKQDVEAYGLAMNASAEVSPNVTLKSISAWRKDRSFTPIDFDSLPAADVDVPALYRNEQISQEFQVLYESSRVNGLVGFYYLDAKATTDFDVILGTTGALLKLPGLNAFTSGDVRTETYSFFGDVTVDVTPVIAVSVGGRYTNDRRRARVLRQTKIGGLSPLFGGTAVPIATTSDFNGEKTFKEFTPRVSVSFKPAPDQLVYASYSKGFKGGGFDPRGQSTQAADTNGDGVRSPQEIFDFFLFDPETVDSYEAGYKGSLFDRRLTLALTGFYADYKNVQIPGSVGCVVNGTPSFCGVTTNAAKATFKGVEFEGTATLARDLVAPGSRLNLAGTAGYLNGQYKRYIVNGMNVADLRAIQNTPKWTASTTLSFDMPVGAGDLYASTTVSYRSLTHQFEVPSPFLDQPKYALLDASIVYSAPGSRYSVGLHGRNLLDKQYISSGYQFIATAPDGTPLRRANGNVIPTLGQEGVVTAFYGNPRQVFLTVGFNF